MSRRRSFWVFAALAMGCGGVDGTDSDTDSVSEDIIGGTPAVSTDDYPGIAALIGYGTPQIPDNQFCGGILITPRWAMTAAHCFRQFPSGPNLGFRCKSAVDARDFTNCEVDLGSTNWLDSYDPDRDAVRGETFFRITRILPHSAYSEATMLNDIALVELESDVPLFTAARAGILGRKWVDRIEVGETTTAVGWGYDRIRGEITNPIFSQGTDLLVADNLAYFGNHTDCINLSDWPFQGLQPSSSHLCAGSVISGDHDSTSAQTINGAPQGEVEQGTCKGDSGGPLYYDVANAGLAVLGITSGSLGCALDNYPTWFTRAGDYLNAFRMRDGNPFRLSRPIKRVRTPGFFDTLVASNYGNNSRFQGTTINHTPIAGDFNNDGFDDIVYYGICGSNNQRCWRVHVNRGNGSFNAHNGGADIAFGGTAPRHRPMAGDFNNDGAADIAYYGICGGDAHACWRVHLSNGSASFTANDYGNDARFTGNTITSTPVAGDFNGDGWDDIAYAGICGANNASCWRVHLNDQNGRFRASNYGGEIQFQGTDANNTPMAGDFDGDGYDDIAYYGLCPGDCWRVHLNTREGAFAPVSFGGNMRFRGNDVTATPVASDLNGDGFTDIAYSGICGNNNARCMRVHLNLHNGSFHVGSHGDVMSFEGADANNTPMAGDFDGDGSSGMGYFGTTDGSIGWRTHQLP